MLTAWAWGGSRQSSRASSSASGMPQSHISALIQCKLTLPGVIGSRKVLTSYLCSSKFQAWASNVRITSMNWHRICIALRQGWHERRSWANIQPGLCVHHQVIWCKPLGTLSLPKPAPCNIRPERSRGLSSKHLGRTLLLQEPGAATDKPRAHWGFCSSAGMGLRSLQRPKTELFMKWSSTMQLRSGPIKI